MIVYVQIFFICMIQMTNRFISSLVGEEFDNLVDVLLLDDEEEIELEDIDVA